MTTLVVVPTHHFGLLAVKAGLIDPEAEHWECVQRLGYARGRTFDSWRYLDSLDQPPGPGARSEVVEAWLARDESPFPPLAPDVVASLDIMVALSRP